MLKIFKIQNFSKKNSTKHVKIEKGNRFPCYYFSSCIAKVRFSLEIRNHGVFNSLDINNNSETRGESGEVDRNNLSIFV